MKGKRLLSTNQGEFILVLKIRYEWTRIGSLLFVFCRMVYD